METWRIVALGNVATGLFGGVRVWQRYRRDLQAARKRAAKDSQLIEARGGRVEFGESGHGAPVLLIHGAGGGYDQGLLLGGLLLGQGFRFIAPSRFGYLKSPVPEDSSLEAQADAFACLLGTPSSVCRSLFGPRLHT